jgi:hypothetical protein
MKKYLLEHIASLILVVWYSPRDGLKESFNIGSIQFLRGMSLVRVLGWVLGGILMGILGGILRGILVGILYGILGDILGCALCWVLGSSILGGIF